MIRGALIGIILLLASFSLAITEDSYDFIPLEIDDSGKMYSYGSNSQNLSFTTTLITSTYNNSVTALGYDSEGNVSFGGTMCLMYPAEYLGRNGPSCDYQAANGSSSHTGYGPAIFGKTHRNGGLSYTEIINSTLGGDRIDDILYLSNGDVIISGWFCWGNAALPTAPIITDDQVAQIDTASTADMPTKTGAGQYSASQSTDAVKRAVDGLQEPIKTSPKDAGFTPPPPGTPVTQAMQRFFNPTTGQEVAVMTGGFATVSGGVLAIYVSWLTDIQGIAGHLLAASVMSAPAALVVAKIIYPETEESQTMGDVNVNIEQTNINAMEALSNGATDGLKLAANIAAMLIAFISFVAMVNYFLSFGGTSMEEIFGIIFRPLAWTMGVPWNEAQLVGMLMGKKIVLTELVAYGDLQNLIRDGMISERSAIISTYALCGFSNFASIGIQLGGIGAMAPERKKDLAKLVTKAMFGGAIASWLTATIAGLLL